MSGVDAHTNDVVRVKPLEWEERTHLPFVLDVIGWAARDCFGEYYEISIEPDGLWLDHECLISGVLSDTLEAAKAAAQADYSARILSAIEPSAAYIALTAELTELRLQCIAADGQAGEHYDARIAAEAERDRLRAALEDALAGQPQDDSCEAWAAHARAALNPAQEPKP